MGTLRVHAVEISTGKDLRIELKIGSMDEAQVDEARRALTRYAVNE